MGFFDEWTDGKSVTAISGIITLTALLALMWVVTNVPPEASRAQIFLFLGIVGTLIWAIDYLKEGNRLFGALDLGKDRNAIFKALAIGAGGVFVLMKLMPSFAIAAPTLATTILSENGWLFFYIVLIAPWIEEKFFRGAIFPTLSIYLTDLQKGWVSRYAPYVAVLATSVIFAGFHYLAYGASGEAMKQAFIFSTIAIFGNFATKSLGFGIGMHIMNNFLAFQAMS